MAVTADATTTLHVPTRLGRLQVQVRGSGDPVVLWHSMFTDSGSWRRLLPLLAGRRLVLVDGPSAGGSDPLRRAVDIGTCAAAAEDLLAGLVEVLGPGPVSWLGCAWGGHVSLHLAATRPDLVRDLVAVSAPTHPVGPRLRRLASVLVPLYRVIGPRGPVRRAILDTLFTERSRAADPGGVALVLDPLDRAARAPMARAIRTAVLNRTDLAWAARRTTCPVLLVTTDDRGEWTPQEAAAMAAQMPDGRAVTIAGSRVLPSIEQPAALAAELRTFWAGRGGARDGE
ncbi:Pimeloyl-ACP methyl ester carboxylesterase [Friedmanniella luteola]|uniref:Pimeloyl-ACP methyl ester carboxylesterase n=1 Tax=Friedmanniella luteola TaxID=546871 RepID=A0A1H1VLX9_9ACTN|nr:alpha/beta hydrolase [Friedmanniella luteola]SDS85316.1 Pimeloyl-ACP methyl ester carboxylesterase [Friedmanniella luteola]